MASFLLVCFCSFDTGVVVDVVLFGVVTFFFLCVVAFFISALLLMWFCLCVCVIFFFVCCSSGAFDIGVVAIDHSCPTPLIFCWRLYETESAELLHLARRFRGTYVAVTK